MLTDDPNVRKAVYYVTFILGVIVIVLGKIQSPWAQSAADGVNELIAYLAGITGLVAASNVKKPPSPPTSPPDGGSS